MKDTEFEPVEPDPRAMRRTVLFLVGLALLSAIFIPWAYRNFLEKQSSQFRPPYEGVVKKNISLRLIDGRVVKTSELLGEVWVAWLTTAKVLDSYNARRSALAKVPEGIKQLVFLLDVKPSIENKDLDFLKSFPEKEDVWYVMADADVVREYLKEQLKVGVIPYQKEGVWHYDERVIVAEGIEKPNVGHHLRGAFDFEKARRLDIELSKKQGDKAPKLEQRLLEHFLKTLFHLYEKKPKQ